MIRGVNRQTIEIKETGNPFFERAILFVTESGAKLSQQQLEAQWNSFLNGCKRPPVSKTAQTPSSRRNRNRRIKKAVTAIFWTGTGVVFSILFRLIF